MLVENASCAGNDFSGHFGDANGYHCRLRLLSLVATNPSLGMNTKYPSGDMRSVKMGEPSFRILRTSVTIFA